MARIATRRKDKSRAKTPSFSFTTRKLQGVPDKSTPAEQESKNKAIQEFLNRRDGKVVET